MHSSKASVTINDGPKYVENGIEGLPSLRFDRTEGNYLTANALTQAIKASNEVSFFVVAKSISNTGGAVHSNILVSMHDASGGNVFRFSITPNTGELTHCGTGASCVISSSGFHNASHIFYFSEKSSESGEFFVDGAQVTMTQTLENIDYNSNGITTFSIGQEYDGATASDFFDGLIGEIVVFDRALKKSERISIESYLKQKWGI